MTRQRLPLSAYLAGLGTCVAWSLTVATAMDALLSPGSLPFQGPILQVGYACTGLTLLLGVGMVRTTRLSPAQSLMGRTRLMLRTLTQAFPVALFGLCLHLLSGENPEVRRYARTFAALPTVMFLALGPWPTRRPA